MKRTSLLLAMVLGLIVLLTSAGAISYAMSPADVDLIRKIDGRRYTYRTPQAIAILDVRGNIFVEGYVSFDPVTGAQESYQEIQRFEIQGREIVHQSKQPLSWQKIWCDYATYIISDDGGRITVRAHFSDGDIRETIYFWQR